MSIEYLHNEQVIPGQLTEVHGGPVSDFHHIELRPFAPIVIDGVHYLHDPNDGLVAFNATLRGQEFPDTINAKPTLADVKMLVKLREVASRSNDQTVTIVEVQIPFSGYIQSETYLRGIYDCAQQWANNRPTDPFIFAPAVYFNEEQNAYVRI